MPCRPKNMRARIPDRHTASLTALLPPPRVRSHGGHLFCCPGVRVDPPYLPTGDPVDTLLAVFSQWARGLRARSTLREEDYANRVVRVRWEAPGGDGDGDGGARAAMQTDYAYAGAGPAGEPDGWARAFVRMPLGTSTRARMRAEPLGCRQMMCPVRRRPRARDGDSGNGDGSGATPRPPHCARQGTRYVISVYEMTAPTAEEMASDAAILGAAAAATAWRSSAKATGAAPPRPFVRPAGAPRAPLLRRLSSASLLPKFMKT